jgi:hypothetical protein
MKPINEWTLTECVDALRIRTGELTDEEIASIAYRIHELTRWIPVEERLPTEEDGVIRCIDGQYAESEFTAKFDKGFLKRWTIGGFDNMGWYKVDSWEYTHWRRIDTPEGV